MQGVRTHPVGAVAGGLALLLAASGCTTPGVTQAGYVEPTTSLTLGVADQPGRFSWEIAEEFSRRVETATDGAVRVEVTNEGLEVARWNQNLAEEVVAGRLDLGLVQAQAWDALDVGSFVALYVPFLVTDDEALDAVTASDVAAEMLAGLDGSGVSGLALVPGGLRHLFATDEAPAHPTDLAGLGVRSAYSETVWAMLEALGAWPDDPNGPAADRAIADGDIAVVDSTFQLAGGGVERPATAGDVVIYPLAFSLVAHDGALEALSTRHGEALRVAAAQTAQWAADTRLRDAEQGRRLCETTPGARVVLAGEDGRRAWSAATSDLAAELRTDPQVDELATRLEQVVAEAGRSEPATACEGPAEEPAPATADLAPNVPEEFPEGRYRKEVTAEDLMALGVNAPDAHLHAGVAELILRDGVLDDPGCPGSTYAVVDDRLVITMGPSGDPCGNAAGKVLFSSGWRLEGDALTFTDVRSGHGSNTLVRALFGNAPWTRID